MSDFIFTVASQLVTFLPLALAIFISFRLMRATDMTLDGSFVLGASIFARLIELSVSPIIATLCAVVGGMLAGLGVSLMQYRQKIDSLLAGILATYILTSLNLLIMSRPNISLIGKITLFSSAFSISDASGYTEVALVSSAIFLFVMLLLRSRFGLLLKAFGDNPGLLKSMGKSVELYRAKGFMLTNGLSAMAGCMTAQTVGYADVGMGFGMTLTGLAAIILGAQLVQPVRGKKIFLRYQLMIDLLASLMGITLYFFLMNTLLRFDVNPLYLKMILGGALIFCLRMASVSLRGRINV